MSVTSSHPFGGSPYPQAPPPLQPERPRAVSRLLRVLVLGFTLVCLLFTIGAIAAETGFSGLVTGLILAAIPTFPVIATFLWLDRYEAEPAYLLTFAFAWGAGVATFAALVINTASSVAIQQAGGEPSTAAIVVAPVTEEFFKGLAVLLIMLVQRKEFDGIVDGIVYAGMVGIGFAFVENILYLGRTLAEGTDVTLVVFILRCIVSPFAHPLFTSAIGIGLGLAVRSRNPLLRIVYPVLGFAVAVFLHGAWNLSASSGLNGLVSGYVLLQMPVFILFIVLAVVARNREGQLIRRNLGVYVATGWLSPGEAQMLGSLTARRQARGWAQARGGDLAETAMADFQDHGSELAFLRERINRGTATPDAASQEGRLLGSMVQLRRLFLGQASLPNGDWRARRDSNPQPAG